MILLDSNVLAYAFYKNAYAQRCRALIAEDAMINTIALIEAFNIIEREAGKEHAEKAVRSLLKSSLRIVNTDVNLVFEALKRAKRYKLTFIDLVHYVTALLHNCEAIASYDSDFDVLEIKRIT